MTEITRAFRDGQLQSSAVREAERSIAARKEAIETLKASIATAHDENARRRQALAAASHSIQPLQAEVDGQWAERNAFTAHQSACIEANAAEESLLADKTELIRQRSEAVAAAIEAARADAAQLIPTTAARIAALERQLEADSAALGHLERLVRADDVAVGDRIEAFDAATGGRYPVDIVAAEVKGMVGGDHQQQPGTVVNIHAAAPRRHNQFAHLGGGNGSGGAAPSIHDIEQSMMLMADDTMDGY